MKLISPRQAPLIGLTTRTSQTTELFRPQNFSDCRTSQTAELLRLQNFSDTELFRPQNFSDHRTSQTAELLRPQNFSDHRTFQTAELFRPQNFSDCRTSQTTELFRPQNFSDRRTSQTAELLRPPNFSDRRTSQTAELLRPPNFSDRRTFQTAELLRLQNFSDHRTFQTAELFRPQNFSDRRTFQTAELLRLQNFSDHRTFQTAELFRPQNFSDCRTSQTPNFSDRRTSQTTELFRPPNFSDRRTSQSTELLYIMSREKESTCLSVLGYIRRLALDFELDLDLKEIFSHTRSLSTDIGIVQNWKNAIKAIESDENCTSLFKNLRGYLKFLFGNEKGNVRRKDVIYELKKLSFDITVLVGLSCPDTKKIDLSVCEAIVNLYPEFKRHYPLTSIFGRENVRDKILSEIITYAEKIHDGRIGFDQLRNFQEAEPRTSRKHDRDDSEQAEIESAERPLKTRPKPSHGHGGSISGNDQRLTQSDEVEEHNDKANNNDGGNNKESTTVATGDIYKLGNSSLIDLVFEPKLVTSIVLTVRPPDEDPSKASFLTIWADRELGDELAKKHVLEEIWRCSKPRQEEEGYF
ncbi:hypothetical protein Forpi1262_v017218 [Fusarium oxysporum f. sp. raphani]|uniref:Uncharacterized protein n=1 Tax=Fusarium oxysporum f. sp. raphani TaxID=96318 RepID=A0A8J5NW68_FUSOX|nr:hypothetical protein Forpi1262_v017218 [Fusarium oxysporum f. sp. raphani]